MAVINPIFVLFITKNWYRYSMCFWGNEVAIFYRLKITNLEYYAKVPVDLGYY